MTTTQLKEGREFLGINRPSQALQAMVQGIDDALEDDGFLVSMFTFGSRLDLDGEDICMGCAATCALRHLRPGALNPDNITQSDLRWKAITQSDHYEDLNEVSEFENVMDMVRAGDVSELFHFFAPGDTEGNGHPQFTTRWDHLWYLHGKEGRAGFEHLWRMVRSDILKVIQEMQDEGV